MNPTDLYQQIAEAYHTQAKYQERDRFLVLALDAAQDAGQYNLAEQLRQRLLELNPNHLIKPYLNCAIAVQSPNFINYISQLRKNFPAQKAQALLQELGGSSTPRPKRTMLADSSFPTAEPVDDRKTPNWSQINVDIKTKPTNGPSIGVYNIPTEPLPFSAGDPLANVPVSPQPPVPFKLEQPTRQTPSAKRQPEIIPAPRTAARQESENPTSVWVGNLLFVVLFLVGIATLAYIFVLPFYPEVAKMLKSGG